MSDINNKKRPVIFVPGLFGSMGNEIVPGTGDWSFGIAGLVYEPFIGMLETMGYKLDDNLFIAFYDWRKSCSHSARKYLLEKIKHAKRKTGAKKVDLICHSMGGLVARSYVQSDYYNSDVEKMILMATPNAGSPPSFSYWTGGELPESSLEDMNLIRLYMVIYLWIIGEMYKGNKIEEIHKHFPGLKDLVPCKDYGDYLYYMKKDDITVFKPQDEMKTQNTFLDELNNNMDIIEERRIKVTLIAGTGEETVVFLQIVPSDENGKWVDGRVVTLDESNEGDGSAMVGSVFNLNGIKYIVEGSHIEMLYKSEPILRKILSE